MKLYKSFCSSQSMPIYKVLMEEVRCGAVFPGNSIPVLMIQGKSGSVFGSFTKYFLVNALNVRRNGKCAQCSTKFAPILELCVEGSIYPEAAWVEPLLEHDPHVKDENPCYLFSFAKCPVA